MEKQSSPKPTRRRFLGMGIAAATSAQAGLLANVRLAAAQAPAVLKLPKKMSLKVATIVAESFPYVDGLKYWKQKVEERTGGDLELQIFHTAQLGDELLDAGIQIHLYAGHFLHAKHLSIDDCVALIGSSNMDIRSFRLNSEVSVLIYDSTVVASLSQIQERYFTKSHLLGRDEWGTRWIASHRAKQAAELIAGEGIDVAVFQEGRKTNPKSSNLYTYLSKIPNIQPIFQAEYQEGGIKFGGSSYYPDVKTKMYYACYHTKTFSLSPGTNLGLEPGRRIVQSWRTTDWPEGHYSKVTIRFEPARNGETWLILNQSGVPEEHFDTIEKGWYEYYWEPLKRMFALKN